MIKQFMINLINNLAETKMNKNLSYSTDKSKYQVSTIKVVLNVVMLPGVLQLMCLLSNLNTARGKILLALLFNNQCCFSDISTSLLFHL